MMMMMMMMMMILHLIRVVVVVMIPPAVSIPRDSRGEGLSVTSRRSSCSLAACFLDYSS